MNNREKFSPPTVPMYYDIPSVIYHDSDGISSSGLKLFMQSPQHYFDKYLADDREIEKSTPARELGTQIHTAILEPERYFQQYYCLPEKYNRATKQGKADFEYHEAKAKIEGRELITLENHEICQKIAEAIHQSEAASFFFQAPGKVEKSFYWHDEKTGVLCKCRPDKLLDGLPYLLDLKSTTDASPAEFSKSIYNFGYHISAEFYRRGVEAVTGRSIDGFVFAAFEKVRPFARAFYQPSFEMGFHAAKIIDDTLEKYAACLANNEWPGFPDQVIPIGLPGWVKS